MKVIKFEDLIAWQKAQDLAVEIYTAFEQTRDFAFRSHRYDQQPYLCQTIQQKVLIREVKESLEGFWEQPEAPVMK